MRAEHAADESPIRTQIHLIAGGLGAGKSTLIRQILEASEADSARALVLHPASAIADDRSCLCCRPGEDLFVALSRLAEGWSPTPGARILVEVPAAADPTQVLIDLLSDFRFARTFRIGAGVYVLDGRLPVPDEGDQALRASDIAVITRVEPGALASTAHGLEPLSASLSRLHPDISVFSIELGIAPLLYGLATVEPKAGLAALNEPVPADASDIRATRSFDVGDRVTLEALAGLAGALACLHGAPDRLKVLGPLIGRNDEAALLSFSRGGYDGITLHSVPGLTSCRVDMIGEAFQIEQAEQTIRFHLADE